MSRHRRQHAFLLQRIVAWTGLIALVMTLGPLQPAAAAAMPTLTLDPNRGPCTTQVTARGEDFPAGATIAIFSRRIVPPSDRGSQVAQTTADATGSFAVTLPRIGPDCGGDTEVGTLYNILAAVAAIDLPDPARSAEAGFTVMPAVPATERCFSETKQCLRGEFLTYWEENGGLPVFGYPITAARPEVNRDTGRAYLTQWFERNRFELHPENRPPYRVLLGRLGDDQLRQRGIDWQGLPGDNVRQPGCLWFQQTQLNVCDQATGNGFMTYWQTHGLNDPALDPYGRSLALFGLPLTRPQMVTNSSGDTVLTQWFERARFEWHPNKPDQFKVLLGLLGNELRGPDGAPVPGDVATARTTLVTYFSALHEGRYREAVQFYGGSYDTLRDWNPDVAADNYAVLLERGCQSNGLRCLTVRRIVQEETLSPREFRFVVEFSNRDGSLFRHATRTQFTYTVTKIGDRFLVEGLPVYVS